jgi:hypothetical protein
MYLHDTLEKSAFETLPLLLFRELFTDEQVARTQKVEIWATSATDPGDDHCTAKLFDANGVMVGEVIIPGY